MLSEFGHNAINIKPKFLSFVRKTPPRHTQIIKKETPFYQEECEIKKKERDWIKILV